MESRKEFVIAARQEGANFRELCRRYGVSAQTGYKWARRYAQSGDAGLFDVSRRPKDSPLRTPAELEEKILAARLAHPAWGGRKICGLLRNAGTRPPSPSTVTQVLRRHGLLAPLPQAAPEPRRFERAEPNALWQMDFKGPLATGTGKASLLSVLDDHSRACLCLGVCPSQEASHAVACLERALARYGLPEQVLCDNAGQWRARDGFGPVTVWLAERGVQVVNGRPYHPQTQGKVERFHRTLAVELLRGTAFASRESLQRACEAFREEYNTLRPHDALAGRTPMSVYRHSRLALAEAPRQANYPQAALLRRVYAPGRIDFKGARYLVPDALVGRSVGVLDTPEELVVLFHETVVKRFAKEAT